jgi:hypothetical protein
VTSDSNSERAILLADMCRHLVGEVNRRGLQRLASRYLWRERQLEAAALGYLDLGEAGC